MKIGILTYHRSRNYGALLQAKALQEYVSSLGHEVYLIDYWPEYHDQMYKPFSWSLFKQFSIKSKFVYIRKFLFTGYRTYKRQRKTERYIDRYLLLSNDKKYDVVLYGSDQIWRKQNFGGFKGYNPVYFGEGYVETSHKIAYAVSMGKIEIDTDDDKAFIKDHLQMFDAISIREIDLIDFLEQEFGTRYQLVCDPVMLLNKEQMLKNVDISFIPSEKYIFYYRLKDLKSTDQIVKEIVRQTGYRVVEFRGHIPYFHYGRRYRVTADAQEFLSLLSGAEYVVSSSFHGVALSILLEKQFFTISKIERASRLVSLLTELGLTDRFVKGADVNIEKKIDYKLVSERLQTFSNQSREWLKEQLSKAEITV